MSIIKHPKQENYSRQLISFPAFFTISNPSKYSGLARIILSAGFALLLLPAFSQTYFFEYIKKVNYGLANEKIYSVVIDKNQKVWMGTGDGLSTFDGNVVENYSKLDGLAEYGVRALFIDSRGFIWMGHNKGGISRFDGSKIESRTDKLIFKDNDITSFCEDAEGNLWITSAGSGAIKVSNPAESLHKLQYEQYKGNRLGDQIYSCVRLHDDKIYFVTNPLIKIYNPKNNNFETLKLQGMPTFFLTSCIFEDKDNNIWFGTYNGGLYEYLYSEKKFKVYDYRDGLAHNFISTLHQDKNGDIWVGHFEGGGITRIRNNNIINIFNKGNGLADDNIYAINEDSEGNILIATKNEGLAILKDERFTLFISDEKKFPSTEVWSFFEDNDKVIWFGTNNGLVKYNPNSKTGQSISIIPGEDFFKPVQVRNLKQDRDKNIWIGCADYGMFVYRTKTKKFEQPISLLLLDDFKEITALDIDKNNQLWIGTRNYLYLYNPKEETGVTMTHINGLASNDITSIYIDKKNTKYVGSGQGLTIIKDSLNTDCPVYNLGGATPNCITEDIDGNIWIGTQNRGVICFKDGKITREFTRNDGLLSDVISSISFFNGSLFVGTGIGMNRINLKTNNIFTYTERNGLPGIETKHNSIFVDSKNSLWIGTVSGAVRYSPKNENLVKNEPQPVIKSFIVNLENIEMTPKVKLSANQNHVVLDYYCVSLTNPDAVLYKVKLEGGAISEWQVTKETQSRYLSLAPGTYTFKVLARNYAGIWSSVPAEFTFKINPPFYQTWWFRISAVIAGLSLILSYIKVRERNLLKEKHVLEVKVKERTTEIVKINQVLELKNKDIVSSIQYASRIQNALLPPDLPFDNSFVLFKPKDIVSGDFFWFLAHENMEWFAAVDCTGHGVPGAFMSIIGHNSLNKILQEYNITLPSEILNHLNEEIAATLHHYHHDNQIHDGMDIALASYDKDTHILNYSGAFNPLWLIRKNELLETRANRYAIGLAPEIDKNFTNNEIQIQNGDTIYLFSDGYADQFGGPDNKKLKVGTFKEVLLSIQQLSMTEQKKYLDDYIEKWRGEYVQVDDILIIGRRFEF